MPFIENYSREQLETAKHILGISEIANSDLSEAIWKPAYKSKALKLHPDRHSRKSPEEQSAFAEQFKLLAASKDLVEQYISDRDKGMIFEDVHSRKIGPSIHLFHFFMVVVDGIARVSPELGVAVLILGIVPTAVTAVAAEVGAAVIERVTQPDYRFGDMLLNPAVRAITGNNDYHFGDGCYFLYQTASATVSSYLTPALASSTEEPEQSLVLR